MLGKGPYPPTAIFRELSREDQIERLDVAEDLLDLVKFWRGDPRLSAWQEGFLATMAQRLTISQGKYKVSHKEWDKIREIQDLMEQDEDEDGDDELEADGD
jgi:hypothetical protein